MTRPSRAELAANAWHARLEACRPWFEHDRARCYREARDRLDMARDNLRIAWDEDTTWPEEHVRYLDYALEHLCVALWLRDVARDAIRAAPDTRDVVLGGE